MRRRTHFTSDRIKPSMSVLLLLEQWTSRRRSSGGDLYSKGRRIILQKRKASGSRFPAVGVALVELSHQTFPGLIEVNLQRVREADHNEQHIGQFVADIPRRFARLRRLFSEA